MGVLKRGSSLVLVMALNVNNVNAGISDFIQGALNASTTETSAGYYKSQVAGLATLGGARVRWGGVDNVRPVNFQTPHINIGCSGIDMVFGGFSYLNFDYLIEKLKKISTAAPAFAFKMALSTLCKDCDTIMTALEDISNTINTLNFESCQALSNWSDRAGEKLSGVGLTGVQGGQVGSWLQGMNDGLSQWVGKTSAFINGQGNNNADGSKNTTNIFSQGSLLKRGLEHSENIFKRLMGNEDYEKILRAVLGDVIGYETEEKIPKFDYLGPTLTPEEFVKSLIGDKNTNQTELTIAHWSIEEKGDSGMFTYRYLGQQNLNVESYYEILKRQIQEIINKGDSNEPLDNRDIEFINSLDLPTWHLINIAIANGLYTDPYIEVITSNAFKDLIKTFAKTIFKDIGIFIGSLQAKEQFGSNLVQTREAVYAFRENVRIVSNAIIEAMEKQINQNKNLLETSNHLKVLYEDYIKRSQSAK